MDFTTGLNRVLGKTKKVVLQIGFWVIQGVAFSEISPLSEASKGYQGLRQSPIKYY